jgi:hypothetical protein
MKFQWAESGMIHRTRQEESPTDTGNQLELSSSHSKCDKLNSLCNIPTEKSVKLTKRSLSEKGIGNSYRNNLKCELSNLM